MPRAGVLVFLVPDWGCGTGRAARPIPATLGGAMGVPRWVLRCPCDGAHGCDGPHNGPNVRD